MITADSETIDGSAADCSTSANAATVAEIYAAFGRGDVPTILDTLADGVAWDVWPDNFAQRAGAAPASAPRPGAGRGILRRYR
jgi:hypothetical protein